MGATLCYTVAQKDAESRHLSLRIRRELHERLTRAASGGPESRSRLAASGWPYHVQAIVTGVERDRPLIFQQMQISDS